MLLKIRCGNNREQIARQKRRERRDHSAPKTGDQIANEPDGDHHRAWRDHGHSYGIDKLLIVQPAVFLDDPTIEKWHNCQTAAKHERPGLCEEYSDLPKS